MPLHLVQHKWSTSRSISLRITTSACVPDPRPPARYAAHRSGHGLWSHPGPWQIEIPGLQRVVPGTGVGQEDSHLAVDDLAQCVTVRPQLRCQHAFLGEVCLIDHERTAGFPQVLCNVDEQLIARRVGPALRLAAPAGANRRMVQQQRFHYARCMYSCSVSSRNASHLSRYDSLR